MKLQRAPINIFNLAFLDIISCAFGAVVMLILLAKNGDEGQFNDTRQISNLIQRIVQVEVNLDELEGTLSNKQELLKQMQANSASNVDKANVLEADISRAKNNVQQLTNAESGLKITKIEQQRAATTEGKATERDEEVGGIPVDSDYVIFIVDTSGSMKRIWAKVLNTMSEVLNNHPRVKGFQVMSDNGEYLMSSSRGRWGNDTPQRRKAILNAMKNWNGWSSSSPMEGIEESLKTYAQKTGSLALYIMGDDYTGGSYDVALSRINRLNTNRKTGKKVARIHGIGFISAAGPSAKFSTLMREISRQNNGTFMTVY